MQWWRLLPLMPTLSTMRCPVQDQASHQYPPRIAVILLPLLTSLFVALTVAIVIATATAITIAIAVAVAIIVVIIVAVTLTVAITFAIAVAVTLANPTKWNVCQFRIVIIAPSSMVSPSPTFHCCLQHMLIVEYQCNKVSVDWTP
jgi:hypothetical protein